MAAEAEKTRKLDFEEIQIPPGPRLGSIVVEVEAPGQGLRRRVLIDDLSFTLPRNGIVGVIGPNGVGKTTLFKMIVGAGEAGRRRRQGSARRSRSPTSTRTAPASTRRRRLGGRLRTARLHPGRQRRESRRAYVSAFGFKGPTSRSRRACCPAASATG
jgi:ATPase subunit of ABC transporter with duplicated ATPase domains